MYKSNITEDERHYRIGHWTASTGFSKLSDALMSIILSIFVVSRLSSPIYKFSLISILVLFFVCELTMLIYVLNVFYSINVDKEVQSGNNLEVFSISDLINCEDTNDLTTPPMILNQWEFIDRAKRSA